MLLKALGTGGAVTSTGTLTCESRIMGGVLITADGTNNCTVIVKKDNASGDQVFDIVTKSPIFVAAPISLGSTQTLYHDVSGTGGAAMFFEWVD